MNYAAAAARIHMIWVRRRRIPEARQLLHYWVRVSRLTRPRVPKHSTPQQTVCIAVHML